MFNGRRQPSNDGTSRMTRECQVRFCERLGVKFSGPTRLVSRVSPVQTALRNCTRDEGGPFEFGNQVLISSHRKPLSSKAMVVNVAETLGHDLSRQGRERRAQANRCRSVESGLGDVKTGGSPALRDQLGGCPDSVRAASGVQAARSSTRLLCGT